MKVKEVMTGSPSVCELNESLAEAARTMWDADCGVLPVLKDGREVVGLITDRDICMAMAMKDRNPTAISVEEVISGDVYSVAPEDEVQKALELMQQNQVHRLPVINPEGELAGILSMNDIVLKAKEKPNGKTPGIGYVDVVKTYKAICEHRAAVQSQATAGN